MSKPRDTEELLCIVEDFEVISISYDADSSTTTREWGLEEEETEE